MKDFKGIVASGDYLYYFTLTSPGQLNVFLTVHHELTIH